MRRPLVAGNWKMHGSRAENGALLEGLLAKVDTSKADVLVCVPFVYLAEIAYQLRGKPVKVGAQSVCAEAQGAFTGEVSASMLKDVGCEYVLVGHSERRSIYQEDDALVARKYMAVQSQGLIPVLCVGETLEQRDANKTFDVVEAQLAAVIKAAGIASLTKAVVAYEPVWAIGTGRTATPEQAQEVHAFIRQYLAKQDANIANAVQILYGGSVKGANAAELFAMKDVDGGLVGGASLKADEFLKICAAAG
ncbi:MAG TPA: triose-phosphate isomerase [Steroidobacteraceae bacterium]|nr:triose-phosphate isomerase [Steroidobacteraceae bacterium]